MLQWMASIELCVSIDFSVASHCQTLCQRANYVIMHVCFAQLRVTLRVEPFQLSCADSCTDSGIFCIFIFQCAELYL